MPLASKIDPPEQPDEMVYVMRLLKPDPVWHVVRDMHSDRLRTSCGLPVSFGVKQTLMPVRHAKKFAEPCEKCSR